MSTSDIISFLALILSVIAIAIVLYDRFQWPTLYLRLETLFFPIEKGAASSIPSVAPGLELVVINQGKQILYPRCLSLIVEPSSIFGIPWVFTVLPNKSRKLVPLIPGRSLREQIRGIEVLNLFPDFIKSRDVFRFRLELMTENDKKFTSWPIKVTRKQLEALI